MKNRLDHARGRAQLFAKECLSLADHVRRWVNDGKDGQVRDDLMQDDRRWLSTCVSMDTLEDSLEAIKHYLRYGLVHGQKMKFGFGPCGGKYLRLYGVLQALALNQDAISNLHFCLLGAKPSISKDSAWNRVRRLRVCIAGHPHDAGLEGPTFLSRPEIGAHGFGYHSYAGFKKLKAHDVDLDKEIEAYLGEAKQILAGMAAGFPLETIKWLAGQAASN